MTTKPKVRLMFLAACLVCAAVMTTTPTPVVAQNCIPDGGIDDTLYRTHCCSGNAVPGSTYCTDPADCNTDWTSCTQVCGTTGPASGNCR